jgi:hypothetical protein
MQIGASILGIIIRFLNLQETIVHNKGKRPSMIPTVETFRGLPRPIFVIMSVHNR